MTIFAGAVEIALAPLLRRLRTLFPPAISGFIVAIVGIQLGVIGVGDLLGIEHIERPTFRDHLVVGFLTLATMCAFSVWGRGVVRLICSMLGILVGMVGSLVLGLVTADRMSSFLAAPIFALPEPDYLAYDFRLSLIPAFLMAGTAAMLRTVGVITTCQKINDSNWKRPELDPTRHPRRWDRLHGRRPAGRDGNEHCSEPRRRIQGHRCDEALHRVFVARRS